jgi:hypothetical protein
MKTDTAEVSSHLALTAHVSPTELLNPKTPKLYPYRKKHQKRTYRPRSPDKNTKRCSLRVKKAVKIHFLILQLQMALAETGNVKNPAA